MPNSRILYLTSRIAANIAKLHEFLASHSLPEPVFDLKAPSQTSNPLNGLETADARQAVNQDS
jgi:hypothetical protein